MVICKERYIDMARLSRHIVKPGWHIDVVIRYRKATGSSDGDVDAFCSNIERNVARGEVTHSILQSAGRSVLIVNKPLTQGGWVATIEDITERQNLEQERDRNYACLHQIIDHIPSQITVKDARDRRYLLVNRVAAAQFGLSRAAIVGQPAINLFPRATADKSAADDDKALQSAVVQFLAD